MSVFSQVGFLLPINLSPSKPKPKPKPTTNMVRFVALVAAAAHLSTTAQAFAPISAQATNQRPAVEKERPRIASYLAAEPPEGGEELTKVSSSLPGSRMKNMGKDDEDGVFKFWLSATAEGEKIRTLRVQTEREASRKANFPGFKKVSWRDVIVELLIIRS